MSDLSNFERLFAGLKQTLRTEGEFFSNLVKHSGEKGRLNESHLQKILSTYLPKKFALATGFAVSNQTFRAGADGPQLDIIIYDALNNSPLYQSEAFGIFPVEMVYGYIEVKTTLTVERLDRAFEANSKIRGLQYDKKYSGSKRSDLAPRFYLFAYNSDIPKESLQRVVENAYRKIGTAHCHGLYVLQHDVLLSRKALYDPNSVELRIWEEHALPTFLNNIGEHAEGMIPLDQNNEPVSFAMPRADMREYFPPQKTVKLD